MIKKKNLMIISICILCILSLLGAYKIVSSKEKRQDDKISPNLSYREEKTEDGDIEGIEDGTREVQIGEARDKGFLILVNKENSLDRDYKPEDLRPIKYYAEDRSEASRYMREEAAECFHKLVEEAAEEGLEIVMTTAYRSYGFQEILWNNYVEKEGEVAASRYSARPGTSEHQTGLAVDVSSPSVNYALTESFGESQEGKWLAENAHRYGFVIRYPKEKEDITGYLYEPWHIRYVSQPIAQEIYNRNITLEEFLN